MGYRNYNYRGLKKNRYHYERRRYEQRPAEEIGSLLAEVMAGLARWLALAIGRFRGRSSNAPTPSAFAATRRRVAPLRKFPQGGFGTPVEKNVEALPYRKASELLSKGERAVWYPLYHAVKGRYRLFCKVRLADVVRCPPHHYDERRWFRKIGRYHVDFVICDPKTTAPLLVVELDDRGHRLRTRKDRDDFKDSVLRSAGMPIYRITAQQAYDPEALKAQIERLINPPTSPPTSPPA